MPPKHHNTHKRTSVVDTYTPVPQRLPERSERCCAEIDKLLVASTEHHALLEATLAEIPRALSAHGLTVQDAGPYKIEDRVRHRRFDTDGLHWVPRREVRPNTWKNLATTDTSWERTIHFRTSSGIDSTLQSLEDASCETETLCVWISAATFEIERFWRPDGLIEVEPDDPEFHKEVRMIGAAARAAINRNLHTWRHHSASQALPIAHREDELMPEMTPAAWISELIARTSASHLLIQMV